jgi:hypothetical protein
LVSGCGRAAGGARPHLEGRDLVLRLSAGRVAGLLPQHPCELRASLVEPAERGQGSGKGDAGSQVGRMPPQPEPAGVDGLAVPAGAPVLFGERRKGNRRRVHANLASKPFDAVEVIAHAPASRGSGPFRRSLSPAGDGYGAFGSWTGTSAATEWSAPCRR